MAIGGVVIQFKADADKARRDVDKLTRSVEAVGKAGSAQKGMSKFAKIGIGAVAAGAGAGVFALGRLVTSSVEAAAKFEQSQNILQASLGATGGEMAKLEDLAKQLGMSTSFSATDASAAMVELAKAGLSTSQILDGAVAAAMALAATEGMDLATASTYMANAMAMFGIKAKDAGKVADILAAGATASTASVEGLAQGLKYVGSTANGLDVGILDTVTALSALNNVGIDATTAGTSLNRFLLGLVPKSEKAAKGMMKLGLSFQNADGSLMSMPAIIQELNDELGYLSKPDRNKALKDIFGVEGMRAAAALLQLGTSGWSGLREQVDLTGKANEMAAARTKGFLGAVEKLGGAWETLKITLGTPIMDVLTGWIGQATAYFESAEGQKWLKAMESGVATAAQNVKTYIEGTLWPAIQSVWDYFGSPDGQQAVRDFGEALKLVADSITTIGGAVSSLLESPAFSKFLEFLGIDSDEMEARARKRQEEALAKAKGGIASMDPAGLLPGATTPSSRVSGGAYATSNINVTLTPGYYSAAQSVRVKKTYGGSAVM